MKTNISVQCELMKSRLPNRLVHDVTGRKRSAGSLNSARPGFSQLRSFEALPLFFPFLFGRFGASSLSVALGAVVLLRRLHYYFIEGSEEIVTDALRDFLLLLVKVNF